MSHDFGPALGRRAFLELAALTGGLAAGAVTASAAATPAAVTKMNTPDGAYRYWIYGCGDKPAETAKAMKDLGYHVVVGGDAKTVEAVTAAGMESWQCGGAFGTGEDDKENLALDITGTPRVWFGSGSPNSPVIRERNLKSYEQTAAIPGVTEVIRRAMENVYGRFGLGPATSYGSSNGNWADVYTGAAASAGSAAGTASA